MAAYTDAEEREPPSTAVIYFLGALVAAVFCLLTVYMGGRALFGPAEITVERLDTRVVAAGALSGVEIADQASVQFRDAGVDVDAWRAAAATQAAADPDAFIEELRGLVGRGEVEVRVQRYRMISVGRIVVEVAIYLTVISLLGALAWRFFADGVALSRRGRFADGTTVSSRQFT